VRALVALCLLGLVVAGCGAPSRDSSEDFDGDERVVATAIEDLETTARQDDPGKLCAKLLTDRLLAALRQQGTNCNRAVQEAFQDADSFDLDVEDVTMRGAGKATVEVKSGEGSKRKSDSLELERDGSVWKIDALTS
jgi:hypothetical protein